MVPNFRFSSADKDLLYLALFEDLGKGRGVGRDRTSQIFREAKPKHLRKTTARIFSKSPEEMRVAGVVLIPHIFRLLGEKVKMGVLRRDGETLPAHDTIAELSGKPEALLTAERTILNFIRHLTAIATLTTKYVAKVEGTKAKILDTRKTTPALRHLEKYAVLCGGGFNHRYGLYDAILVKNNHVDWMGGMREAMEALPKNHSKTPTIVEVRTLEEIEAVLEFGKDKVKRILLDNMPLDTMQKAVDLIQQTFEVEASGNVTLETVRAIAETGVDFISVGALTHSAGSVDLALHIDMSSPHNPS